MYFMQVMEEEKFLTCPFCNQQISVLLDLSVDGSHKYTEDCEVCCHPIDMNFEVDNNELIEFNYDRSNE